MLFKKIVNILTIKKLNGKIKNVEEYSNNKRGEK